MAFYLNHNEILQVEEEWRLLFSTSHRGKKREPQQKASSCSLKRKQALTPEKEKENSLHSGRRDSVQERGEVIHRERKRGVIKTRSPSELKISGKKGETSSYVISLPRRRVKIRPNGRKPVIFLRKNKEEKNRQRLLM